tara:strand:+ start:260 stop:1207 length:948 start_codon:yes stop_codon:yes gene_type:complete
MRHQLQDLLQTAQRTGDRKQVAELRGTLQRILGNVTLRGVDRAAKKALQKAGLGGKPYRIAGTRRTAVNERGLEREIKGDLAAVSKLIAQMQGPDAPPPKARTERPQVAPAPDPVQSRESGAPMPYNTRMLPNGRIQVKTGTFSRTYHHLDPIITGKYIGVSSSNVRSISFNFNFKSPHKSTLYVQFLGTNANGVRTGHGPLYQYFDISPDKFDAFRKAASKGGWVWDELRVRGSAVQHKVRYGLKGIVDGYVPRRGAIRNGKEMFLKRKFTPGARIGEKAPSPIISQLPNQTLGPARGRPRRGRPSRGRGPRLF